MYLNADPDPGSQTNADSDKDPDPHPGQTLKLQKVEFLLQVGMVPVIAQKYTYEGTVQKPLFERQETRFVW